MMVAGSVFPVVEDIETVLRTNTPALGGHDSKPAKPERFSPVDGRIIQLSKDRLGEPDAEDQTYALGDVEIQLESDLASKTATVDELAEAKQDLESARALRFSCPVCPKQYASYLSLGGHIWVTHAGKAQELLN